MSATLTETQVEISELIREQLLTQVSEEGQVIVHCKIVSGASDTVARIWRTTFLLDKHSSHKCRLLHADGVSTYPEWTHVPAGTTLHFTLVFSPLPKSCTSFDFYEQIPEPGGFYVESIARNKTDVYNIELS
ncbi:MAG: hypothetical protein V4649_16775 [Bacteroidota bacterium]